MIVLDNVTIRQGTFALVGASLRVTTGQYGVLMGRTGSGKTSLLECIAGLRRPASGRVRLGGEDVTQFPPGARGIGYVPQEGALFREMTVYEHLAFAPHLRGWPAPVIDERVRELAESLRLTHLLRSKPHGLSGGESQRVALGRALSFRPRVLLLDEPLASLDEPTRDEMIDLLKRLSAREGSTVLHVTHSRTEAERLADVTFRLEDGAISEFKRESS